MWFQTSRKDRWHADKITGSMFLVSVSRAVKPYLIRHFNDATAHSFWVDWGKVNQHGNIKQVLFQPGIGYFLWRGTSTSGLLLRFCANRCLHFGA